MQLCRPDPILSGPSSSSSSTRLAKMERSVVVPLMLFKLRDESNAEDTPFVSKATMAAEVTFGAYDATREPAADTLLNPLGLCLGPCLHNCIVYLLSKKRLL